MLPAVRYGSSVRTVSALPRRLAWIVLALAAIVVYGTVGYILLEGWSFTDALYMTLITMTTVGFREVRPLDTGGKLFTISVIMLGVGVALVGISLAAAIIAQEEIGGTRRRRKMDRKIEALHGHYIVAAYGRVGRAAVRELKAAGVPFIVVDPDDELRERMDADEIPYLVDDPTLEPVLRRAGVTTARALLSAVDSDATNVYITLTARALNPRLFIVARASEPGSAERLERAGADRVVSPFVSSGQHMVRMALDPSLVDLFDEGSSGKLSLDIEERTIDEGSPLAGRTVADAPGPVLAIRRDDGEVLATPGPTTPLHLGDLVLMLRDDERVG